jgi:uncharacterized membrane protein (GlpM family)
MLLKKALLGGLVVALIVILNKTLGPMAAAISSWLPVFTIIGFVIVSSNPEQTEQENIRKFIIGGLWSLLLLAVFSITVYLTISFISLYLSLFIASTIWFLGALLFIKLTNQKEITK